MSSPVRKLGQVQRAAEAVAVSLPSALDILHCLRTEPPELDYVLPGLVAGTVGGLVAAGGVGKSTWVQQAAVDIAVQGAEMLGMGISKSGRVVMLAGEDPIEVLHQRINAVAPHLSEPQHRELARNFDIVPCVGKGIDLIDPGHFEAIKLRVSGARLVIVDTLTRFHSLDENDAGDAKAVMAALEHLAASSGAAVIFLHHVSKGAALNGNADVQQAARGSSVFVDNARWLGYCAVLSPEEARTGAWASMCPSDAERRRFIRMGVTKQNYGAPVAQRWYRRSESGILECWDGVVPTVSQTSATKAARSAPRPRRTTGLPIGGKPWSAAK